MTDTLSSIQHIRPGAFQSHILMYAGNALHTAHQCLWRALAAALLLQRLITTTTSGAGRIIFHSTNMNHPPTSSLPSAPWVLLDPFYWDTCPSINLLCPSNNLRYCIPTSWNKNWWNFTLITLMLLVHLRPTSFLKTNDVTVRRTDALTSVHQQLRLHRDVGDTHCDIHW